MLREHHQKIRRPSYGLGLEASVKFEGVMSIEAEQR